MAVGRWLATICVLAVMTAAPLRAAKPELPKPPPAAAEATDVAGHYYLEGIMETGSELLLGADGRFQWYFTYGALDLDAQGRWQRDGGDRIVLLPDTFHFPPQYPQTEFKRMQLRIEDGDLIPAWPWEGGNERGRYTRE